jgi:hypothetical protein
MICMVLGGLRWNALMFRDSCRFLWKRIPNPVARKKDLLLQAIWVIGKNLWSRNYEGTFAAISAFRSAFGNPSVHSTLVDILYGMLSSFFRDR